jgi:hypothetical protein
MKLSAVFSLQAILAALFGLWLLVLPSSLMQVYGTTPDVSNVYFARLLGAAYIGIAMVSWGARHTTFETRPLLVPAFATTNSLGVVVALYRAFTAQGSQLLWLNVVIFVVLAAGFVFHTFSPRLAR